jgi:hypothetical protein
MKKMGLRYLGWVEGNSIFYITSNLKFEKEGK